MSKKQRIAKGIREFREKLNRQTERNVGRALKRMMDAAQTPQQSVRYTGGYFEVGKIPVLTSELIDSLSTNGGHPWSESYLEPIANYKLGQHMTFHWTALHAAPMEFGFSTPTGGWVPGRFYVSEAVKNFPDELRQYMATMRL